MTCDLAGVTRTCCTGLYWAVLGLCAGLHQPTHKCSAEVALAEVGDVAGYSVRSEQRGDARNKERKLLSRDESSRSESRIQSSAACLQRGPGLSDRLTDKRGKEDSGCLVQQQGLPRLQVAAKEAQRFESWDPKGWNER